MNFTIWQAMKDDWHIRKRDIKDLGIDPNKQWDEIELRELSILADWLNVTIADLV